MANDTHYRTALVTGASSGIGRCVTAALCSAGFTVHGVARNRDALDDLAEATGCIPHVADVTDVQTMERLLQGIEIDILVNNAGLGRGYDGLVAANADDIHRVVSTNIAGVLNASRIALQGMVARKRGHIVNIGSTTGLHASGLALYGASKGAIHLLGQNLRLELRGTAVRVTEVCPGRVRTPFFSTAFDTEEQAHAITDGLTCLEPEDVADAVVYAVQAPWRCNVSTIELQPTEQTLGGMNSDPVSERG